jgi:phytoene desaturase
MTRAVVVGGGIAGLATAALLARDGCTTTLVEAREELGGRAGSWERDGFRFDTGPSWYLMPDAFDHFFRLMGTTADEQLDLVALDPGYRVYSEGIAEPIEIRRTRADNVALFESIEPGAGAALERYLDSAKSVYTLADQKFLHTTFARFGPIFTRDVLARGAEFARLLLQPLDRFVAKRFTNPRLRQLLGYPAVFLGSSPYATPSMYHLMSHLDLDDAVRYPMGGFTRIIERITALAVEAGVEVRTSTRAVSIRVDDGVATGVVVRDSDGVETTLDADVVVTAGDLFRTETELLPPELQTYGADWWAKRTPGPSALLLFLGVRGELPQLEHHTLLFTEDWRRGFDAIFGADQHIPDPASLYICKPSQTDPDVAPSGHENVFVLVPIPADPTLGRGGIDGAGDASIEAAADRAIAQIAQWAGIPDLAERIVVRRTMGPGDFEADLGTWLGNALGPAHTLRQSAFFRAGNVSKKVDGLFYAGASTIPGIGLPMCLISAELVIKRLRGDVSAGPMPAPLVPSMGGARP